MTEQQETVDIVEELGMSAADIESYQIEVSTAPHTGLPNIVAVRPKITANLLNKAKTEIQSLRAREKQHLDDILVLWANLTNLMDVTGETYSDEEGDVWMVNEVEKRIEARKPNPPKAAGRLRVFYGRPSCDGASQ